MNDVHIGGLDLNLLRVFDALIEARSATRAGERLGLSQSAISHALGPRWCWFAGCREQQIRRSATAHWVVPGALTLPYMIGL